MTLPALPTLAEVSERLEEIFPQGMTQRNYFIREIAAKTVFVMLYAGAIEGSDHWVRPNQVTRMTDDQASRVSEAERVRWGQSSLRARTGDTQLSGRWFADTTREPIRDETLRNALRPVGAVIERPGLDTTSSKPRWALAQDFAELMTCPRAELRDRAEQWRRRHLTAQALSRVALAEQGVTAASAGNSVLVVFPNGEARRMTAGRSTNITKAVVEEFSRAFLIDPGVLWVSESRNKVTLRDDELARRVGLEIDSSLVLPDVILVDLGSSDPVFVFVEIVASDGPIDEGRKAALLTLLSAGGHDPSQAAFVTAFWDRGDPSFRKASSAIARNSFVWCATEPATIIVVRDTTSRPTTLYELLS